jgi:hypothetical protein
MESRRRISPRSGCVPEIRQGDLADALELLIRDASVLFFTAAVFEGLGEGERERFAE